jgi:hypothetical protein
VHLIPKCNDTETMQACSSAGSATIASYKHKARLHANDLCGRLSSSSHALWAPTSHSDSAHTQVCKYQTVVQVGEQVVSVTYSLRKDL